MRYGYDSSAFAGEALPPPFDRLRMDGLRC